MWVGKLSGVIHSAAIGSLRASQQYVFRQKSEDSSCDHKIRRIRIEWSVGSRTAENPVLVPHGECTLRGSGSESCVPPETLRPSGEHVVLSALQTRAQETGVDLVQAHCLRLGSQPCGTREGGSLQKQNMARTSTAMLFFFCERTCFTTPSPPPPEFRKPGHHISAPQPEHQTRPIPSKANPR